MHRSNGIHSVGTLPDNRFYFGYTNGFDLSSDSDGFNISTDGINTNCDLSISTLGTRLSF